MNSTVKTEETVFFFFTPMPVLQNMQWDFWMKEQSSEHEESIVFLQKKSVSVWAVMRMVELNYKL